MKIAICDDEEICLSQTIAVAQEYTKQRLGFAVDAFSNPEDLLDAARKNGGYDIYILDIIMPGMDGIRLGMQLREANYDGKIIYLTSSQEYFRDAFGVRAFDYMIKPIQREGFFKTMDEAVAGIREKKDKTLIVKTKERSIKLRYDSIMYAEVRKRAVCYYLVGGHVVETMTLRTTFAEAVKDLLADPRFAACGQSMVVNLNHVTMVENNAIVFGTTHRSFLGEKLCRKLRDIWSAYWFEQEG